MDYFFLGTKSLGHENSVIRALRRLWLGRLVKIYPCIIHQNKSAAKSTCVRDSLSLFAVSVMLCFWLLSTARTRRLCVAVVIIIIIIIIIDLIRFIERQNVERLPCRCDNIDAGSYWITWILVRFYRCCYFIPSPPRYGCKVLRWACMYVLHMIAYPENRTYKLHEIFCTC